MRVQSLLTALPAAALLGIWSFGALAERVALVIGNGSYRPGYELRNPVADARAVSRGLSDLGFDVTLVEDTDLATAQRALDAFVPKGLEAEAAVIFYAGHGAMISGKTYMLPVDFSMANYEQVDKEALDAERLMQALSSTHAAVKLLVFDACRNNPLESRGGRAIQKPEETPVRTDNMLIAYSTAQGMEALDGSGDHSPFAEGFITHVSEPDAELRALMDKVKVHVRDRTNGKQSVWIESSLSQPFYFGSRASSAARLDTGKIEAVTPPEPEPDAGEVFPQSSVAYLTEDALEEMDEAELRLARNEIFARNGRIFNDPALTRHFEQFDWYRPVTWEPRLNEVERTNVELIRDYEMSVTAEIDGFIFVDSDRRLLEREEVASVPREQLKYARNEIYARRGRKFVRKEFQDYFGRFDWYRPQFGEVELTRIEMRNVELIQSFER